MAEEKVSSTGEEDSQVVNPWEVTAKDGDKIDYDKLIEQFGCQRLGADLVQRVERLTGRPAHVFLRRGVFFAHRFLIRLLFGFLSLNVSPLAWFSLGILMRFLICTREERSFISIRGEARRRRLCILAIWSLSCSPSIAHLMCLVDLWSELLKRWPFCLILWFLLM